MKKLALLAIIALFVISPVAAQDADYYYKQGLANHEKRNLDEALKNYSKAISLDSKYFGAYLNRGSIYIARMELDKAIADFTKAIEINPNVYEAWALRGAVYSQKANFDMVIGDYTRALAIKSDDPLIWNDLGNAYSAKGNYDRAIESFSRALALNPNYFSPLINRGTAYLETGDLNKSLDDLNRAIALDPNRYETYNNRGNTYLAMENYDRAFTDYEKAISLNPDSFFSYHGRGNVYKNRGDYDRALADYNKSISLNPDFANGYHGRGNVYMAKGEINRAIADYTKAVELNPNLGAAWESLASAYTAAGDTDKAMKNYQQSLNAADKSGNIMEIFYRSWEYVGVIYQENPYLADPSKKNFDKQYEILARDALGKSIARAEQVRSSLGSRGAQLMAGQLYQYYAGVDFEVNYGSVEKAFQYSESLRSRGFLEQMGTEAALKLPGIAEGDAKKMRELLAAIEEQQDLLSRLNPQREAEKYAEAGLALTRAENSLAALEKTIAKKTPRFSELRNPKMATLSQAKSFAGKDRAILEFVIWDESVEFTAPSSHFAKSSFPDRPTINSYCLVITSKGVTPVRLDPAYDYSGAVNRLRDGITMRRNIAELEKDRNDLFGSLIKPVLSHLPAGIRELVIIPDSNLGHLPFDILRENSRSPDLGEKYRISLSPSVSVSVLSAKLNVKQTLPVIAFGGAWYDLGKKSVDRGQRGFNLAPGQQESRALLWLDLPGTEKEVKNLEEIINSPKGMQVFLGRNVSEFQIKDLSRRGELAKYPILHFACHGYFNENDPDRSGIVLSEVSGLINTGEDGYLTIPEIVLLDLKAQMVILSACETGLGTIKRGDGMTGMARAFLVSGVKNVGVSLWSIDDEATMAFMTAVYTRVLKEKKSFKEAYFLVKNEFRSNNRWSHPFYWAAFTMYE